MLHCVTCRILISLATMSEGLRWLCSSTSVSLSSTASGCLWWTQNWAWWEDLNPHTLTPSLNPFTHSHLNAQPNVFHNMHFLPTTHTHHSTAVLPVTPSVPPPPLGSVPLLPPAGSGRGTPLVTRGVEETSPRVPAHPATATMEVQAHYQSIEHL